MEIDGVIYKVGDIVLITGRKPKYVELTKLGDKWVRFNKLQKRDLTEWDTKNNNVKGDIATDAFKKNVRSILTVKVEKLRKESDFIEPSSSKQTGNKPGKTSSKEPAKKPVKTAPITPVKLASLKMANAGKINSILAWFKEYDLKDQCFQCVDPSLNSKSYCIGDTVRLKKVDNFKLYVTYYNVFEALTLQSEILLKGSDLDYIFEFFDAIKKADGVLNVIKSLKPLEFMYGTEWVPLDEDEMDDYENAGYFPIKDFKYRDKGLKGSVTYPIWNTSVKDEINSRMATWIKLLENANFKFICAKDADVITQTNWGKSGRLQEKKIDKGSHVSFTILKANSAKPVGLVQSLVGSKSFSSPQNIFLELRSLMELSIILQSTVSENREYETFVLEGDQEEFFGKNQSIRRVKTQIPLNVELKKLSINQKTVSNEPIPSEPLSKDELDILNGKRVLVKYYGVVPFGNVKKPFGKKIVRLKSPIGIPIKYITSIIIDGKDIPVYEIVFEVMGSGEIVKVNMTSSELRSFIEDREVLETTAFEVLVGAETTWPMKSRKVKLIISSEVDVAGLKQVDTTTPPFFQGKKIEVNYAEINKQEPSHIPVTPKITEPIDGCKELGFNEPIQPEKKTVFDKDKNYVTIFETKLKQDKVKVINHNNWDRFETTGNYILKKLK